MKFKINSGYDKSQTLIKKLFPNKESIVINDQLTIEVKYGGLASYTPDYIKQTVEDYNAPHKLDQKKMVDPSRKVKG